MSMEILNTKLTAINDEIRELSGSEGILGLDAMADNVRGGNDEIALQTQLLEQAITELQGKVDPELYENGYAEGYAKGDIDGQVKGYDKALAEGYIKPSGTLEITENNKEYDVASYDKANVAIALENKLPQILARTVTEITAADLVGVTEIGDHAFRDCKKLKSVAIPDGVTHIGKYAFSYCIITSITLPNSITTLGADAFYGCQKLTSAILPNTITAINDYVFYNCYELSNIIIPDSVTSIGMASFQYCKALTSIIIPNGVTIINGTAFNGCPKLKSVTVKAITPPTIQSSTFTGSTPTDCAFYVPAESVEAYKTATNWSARADYIFAIEEE